MSTRRLAVYLLPGGRLYDRHELLVRDPGRWASRRSEDLRRPGGRVSGRH